MRLFILYERGHDPRPFSQSYLRLLRPATHPLVTTAAGATGPVEAAWGVDYAGEPVDAVVVDRLWRPDIEPRLAEDLCRRVRTAGARLIHAMDDDLFAVLNAGPDPAGKRNALEIFVREADGLLLSTDRLRDELLGLNPHTAVVPNLLDERLLVPRAARGDAGPFPHRPLVIGYMGTPTHRGDLGPVLPALRRVVERHGNAVRLEMIGVVEEAEREAALDGVPVRFVGPTAAETEYPLFMLWFTANVRWDVALAPLADTNFNACKSDVKFLDYAAVGAPGIFSDVPAYRGTVRDDENGLLVGNTPAAWEDAIESLLADASLRVRLQTAAARDLWSQRVLAHRVGDWARALEGLVG